MLSAVHPDKMPLVLRNIKNVLKVQFSMFKHVYWVLGAFACFTIVATINF